MKKSKFVLVLSTIFCVLFLIYLKNLDYEMANLEKTILDSSNVLDVTKKLESKFLISFEDMPASNGWVGPQFKDSSWTKVDLPSRISAEKDFKEGNFAYYRIVVPVSLMKNFKDLENEINLSLYYVLFSKVDIYVNGKLYRKSTPKDSNESVIIVPLDETKDNIVAIKGKIKTGDTGISHRTPIILGKAAELNQLYAKSYKGQTVFTLIYILCKGSILFIFALIFFVVRVDKSFEKFLMFGICAVSEDVLRGDYLSTILNFNQLVYLYNVVNIGIVLFLFLFLADVAGKKIKKNHIIIGTVVLIVVCSLISYDVLNQNMFFTVEYFLKFWNISLLVVLFFFLPTVIKVDKILAIIISMAIFLTAWSAFFSENVGHNLKAVGNLLIFFMAAYQTFILFKREQDLLQVKQLELLEQEKDVAIGRTAALLAHDVRRPLEQMNLILNKITQGEVSDDFLKTAKKDVDFSITSVNNQINDIMNFSRTKEITLESINLYRILSGSIKQVLTISKNVNLTLKYDFKAMRFVMGEESRLSSLFTNLISNAVEAIRDIGNQNYGEIRFSSQIENGTFILSIENSGPHIPAGILPEIFKPLFTHGKNKGTGLGLASVAKTMADHGGSIDVFNVADGVLFRMSFKLADEGLQIDLRDFKASSVDYNYEVKMKEVSKKTKVLRLLVLDDDAQVYEYFRFLVEQIDFEVELTFIQNVEEARLLVQTKRFDLYILDYDLGFDKTGLDFYQEELSFLSSEVVIHTNRDLGVIKDAKCRYQQKPMPVEVLKEIAANVYQSRLKLFLVDDSELTLMAWEMFHGKHNVVTAQSPDEALRIYPSNKADLCVVDYFFDNSSMNGEQLGLQLLAINSQAKILIASSVESASHQFKAIRKDFFDVRRL